MQRAFAVDLARLWDTDNLSQSFVIGSYGELFVVGEKFEQTGNFIIGNCGEHFMAVEVILFTNICVRQRGWTKRESMFLILNETEIPE